MPFQNVARHTTHPHRGPLRDRDLGLEVRLPHPTPFRISHEAGRPLQLERRNCSSSQHFSGRAKTGSSNCDEEIDRKLHLECQETTLMMLMSLTTLMFSIFVSAFVK